MSEPGTVAWERERAERAEAEVERLQAVMSVKMHAPIGPATPDVLQVRWRWYWRTTDGVPDCGIYAALRPGHAYAICRCPRYVTKADWEVYATHICNAHNIVL